MEEIKKTGESSIKGLLYMLEQVVGARLIDVKMSNRSDKFSDGTKYITHYIDFTLQSSVVDPDGLSVGQKIIEIDRKVYPFLSNYVLNSKGRLKKVDSNEWMENDYNVYFDKCSYEWGDVFEENLEMKYVYVVHIYLDDED